MGLGSYSPSNNSCAPDGALLSVISCLLLESTCLSCLRDAVATTRYGLLRHHALLQRSLGETGATNALPRRMGSFRTCRVLSPTTRRSLWVHHLVECLTDG